MTNLEARHHEILKILINTTGPITTEKIGEALKVSSRTVRSDLQIIQEWLDGFDIKLVKKPRMGVYLKATAEQKIMLIDKLSELGEYYSEPFDSTEREKYIISRLLQTDKNLTSQQLADELFVSRMTIYKDLENVEKWLGKHRLVLIKKPNYGLEIIGEEENWRKAFADFLAEHLEKDKLKNLVMEPVAIPLDRRLDPYNYKQLAEMFPEIDVRKIERILLEAEKQINSRFVEETYTALIVHLVISIQRLRDKKDIRMPVSQIQKLKETEEFKIASFITEELEKEFSIKIPESETGYISLHILGAKIQKSLPLKEKAIEEMLKDFDDDLIQIVYDIIHVTENTIDVKLSNDKVLVTGLALHLRPVINRIKNGMNLHNPILHQIKENYTAVYGIAWIAAGIIENRLGIKVGEEEVGYLAMHLGAAIDRATSPKRALVVCSSGIGTAQMLAARLKKLLPEIIIEDVVPAGVVDSMLKSKSVDLIITTIPLDLKDLPVILISPLVTESDVIKLRNAIGNYHNIKIRHMLQKREGGFVSHLIPQELIFHKKRYRKKEDIIEGIGKILVEKGYVKHEFIKAALDREKITSTYIGKGVAIPHGEDRLVINPAVSVITLSEPIDWWGEQVDLVFYLALHFDTSKYTKSFFKEFYDMMDNPELLKMIREAKNSSEISKILLMRGEI